MDQALRRARFLTPIKERRPIYYFDLPAPDGTPFEEAITAAVRQCLAAGFGTLIAQLPEGTELDESKLGAVKEMYAYLLALAKKEELFVGFYLDPAFEHLVIRTLGEMGDHSLRAKLLECKEYVCARGEDVNRPIARGTLLSAVAYCEEYAECVDLRPFVSDGKLQWPAPGANFVARQYLLVEDTARDGANYLSYDASFAYISAVFSLFSDTVAPYIGNTLSMLSYSGVGFHGTNRRIWDESFNAEFEKRFGFDPAPYYPALFDYVGKDTAHLKACFMSVRASLLQNGILRALHDFATQQGLALFGNLSEPKLTAPSFSIGDTMLNNIYAPCALFDKAYMYGTNSIKIAAGAAYNFDIDRVNGELFRNYPPYDRAHLYKDAMNAYARGVNCTAMHLSGEVAQNNEFGVFTARVQTMLRGGRHVADIAMLYPIYHLHAGTTLYYSPVDGYEYPETHSTADYMTLINSISIYSGHDLTLLHPEVLNTRCHTEGGVLYLDNKQNHESFRVVVLPATSIISLENLRTLKKFFDEGGKLLATGLLPTKAFEFDQSGENDREVQRLVEEIFGKEACDPRIMRDYCHNKSAAGGEAIFLYFNATATDATKMTHSSTVNEALNAFGVPFDTYLPGMPRFECTGALNSIYPEFRNIGLHRTMPGGGMLNHIHKKHGEADIYYFSNTTNSDYNHHVLLRGAFAVEEWNPHTGKMRGRTCGFLRYQGEIYTTLRLTLDSCTSTFFYALPADTEGKEITDVRSIDNLRSEHAALMSEF
ncbi:MAG: hypothetical protein E7624_04445 [Ruminococcaceae bacterium]|nr:hypothetical protein [Oscillospiraceae bacterium]